MRTNTFHSTEMASSEQSQEPDIIPMDYCCDFEDEISPYPLEKTDAELDERKELEVELGQDWSLKLAANLSSSPSNEAKVHEEKSPINNNVGSSRVHSGSVTTAVGSDETRNIRNMRNALWKSSLKIGLFRSIDG